MLDFCKNKNVPFFVRSEQEILKITCTSIISIWNKEAQFNYSLLFIVWEEL